MGRTVLSNVTCSLAVLAALAAAAGCQPSQELMTRQLTARMSMIDFSGLGPARPVGDGVDAAAAIPRSWQVMPPQSGPLFTHRQWRTPTRSIAVGVVHVRMPLPMSAQTLVWMAKAKYGTGKPDDQTNTKDSKKVPGGPGRLLNEWTDGVGREWVELENDKYHVRGYAVTCGFDAWLVYTGFRRKAMPNPIDLQLAGRSMESVVPDPLSPAVPDGK